MSGSHDLPHFTIEVDGWIDLADIISYMTGIRTEAKRSLRDTLLTFGLKKGAQTLRPHDPGMDAVRTAAALAGLVVCPMRELVIPNRTLQEKESRRQQYKRPSRDIYPDVVRICTQDGSPLPKAISSPLELEEFVKIQFANPIAVAVCPPHRPGKTQKTHGWICLDGVKAMECLVQQLNGCEVDGVGLSLYLTVPSNLSHQVDQPQSVGPRWGHGSGGWGGDGGAQGYGGPKLGRTSLSTLL